MSDWTVHLGDCLDPVTGLASLPDKSVDHVITDPPYSEHVHAIGEARKHLGLMPDRKIRRNGGFGFEHLSAEVRAGVAAQVSRLVNRWAVVFTDAEGVAGWIEALECAGMEHVRVGAWLKRDCMPQFTGDRPGTGFEALVIAHQPGKKRWNGGGRPGIWDATIVKGGHADGRHHNTQKPTDLMEALVRDFTDAGETVLDPFAGSGTTGVACRRLGRRFIGWEKSESYWRIACKRIEAAREQMRMFEGSGT